MPTVNVPLQLKFGYAHMMEMRQIEDELRRAGFDGVQLHFAAISQYEANHKNDPTYRDKQKAWIASATIKSPDDLLRRALEEIRDGHNDPRTLAREVLEAS